MFVIETLADFEQRYCDLGLGIVVHSNKLFRGLILCKMQQLERGTLQLLPSIDFCFSKENKSWFLLNGKANIQQGSIKSKRY